MKPLQTYNSFKRV